MNSQHHDFNVLLLYIHFLESVVLVTKFYLTLCDPMDCSLQGSSVCGILQARILEWVAIFFSKGSSWPRDQTQVSCIAVGFFIIWATREEIYSFLRGLCMCTYSVVSNSLQSHRFQLTRLLCPWNSPDNNTGVGCHFLLQDIFLTQALNSCLLCFLHWQAGSLPAANQATINWTFKATGLFSQILEVRCLKLRCPLSHAPSEGYRECLLCLVQFLVALAILACLGL